MTHLLDTNACIRILNGTAPRLGDRLRRIAPNQVALSTVVKAELLYGARNSRSVARNLQALKRFFLPFATLPFDDLAAEHYGQIRADLARLGTPIGANDLLIAASARARDLSLVTANVGEFSRVVGLRVEDWETP